MTANSELDNYFDNYVKPNNEERSRVLDVIKPLTEEINESVANESDGVFSKKPINVGSHYQGLKAGRTDEFDLSIAVMGISYDDKSISWNDVSPQCITYGFKRIDNERLAKKTSNQSLKIIKTGRTSVPDVGYGRLQLSGTTAKYFRARGLMFGNDLVPYLVRRRFKKLLSQSCRKKSTSLFRSHFNVAI